VAGMHAVPSTRPWPALATTFRSRPASSPGWPPVVSVTAEWSLRRAPGLCCLRGRKRSPAQLCPRCCRSVLGDGAHQAARCPNLEPDDAGADVTPLRVTEARTADGDSSAGPADRLLEGGKRQRPDGREKSCGACCRSCSSHQGGSGLPSTTPPYWLVAVDMHLTRTPAALVQHGEPAATPKFGLLPV